MIKTLGNLSSFINLTKIIQILRYYKNAILLAILVAIFGDVFYIAKSSDRIIFSILIIYIACINVLNVKSKFTFFLCMFLLILMFVSYLFSGTSVATEKAAVWLILFLGVGIIQQWRE